MRFQVVGGLLLSSLALATPTPRSVEEAIVARSEQIEADVAPPNARRSVIHDRVARHVRFDTPTVLTNAQWLRKRQTLGPASDLGGVQNFNGSAPSPQRGGKGSPFLHPSNEAIDGQNPDNVAPPPTDNGNVPNLKWAFSDSHTRLLKGGWVREQTVTDLPASEQIAAAEQSLAPNATRELHWHRVAEWGYVLNGTLRITASDEDDRNFVSDIGVEDLWYFPKGVPHNLQAGPDGAQYLLVFDDGNFDATGTTFMVDDWIAHTPRALLAQNFGWNVSAFNDVPSQDPYILPTPNFPSLEEARQVVGQNPAGEVPSPYTYALSKQPEKTAPGGGGSVKIADYRNFNISTTLASALVKAKPGALRELHWHSNVEWGYIVSGKARATVFAGSAMARTFDLRAGDSWTFPNNWGHTIQNVGGNNEELVWLEIFRAPNFGERVRFDDFSLTQWLRFTPPEVAAKTLNVSRSLIEQLSFQKKILVA